MPSQRFKSVFVPFIVFVTIQGCSLAPYREHSGESINRVPIIPKKKPEATEKKGSDVQVAWRLGISQILGARRLRAEKSMTLTGGRQLIDLFPWEAE